jgi:hypothetical protein
MSCMLFEDLPYLPMHVRPFITCEQVYHIALGIESSAFDR